MFNRHCKECGKPFTAKVRSAVFCSGPCRRTHGNRRAMRGAELYDLVMEWRFARNVAQERKTYSLLCTLAGRFNDADKARGRRSWSSSARMAGMAQSRVGR